MLDEMISLAKRDYPYGRPGTYPKKREMDKDQEIYKEKKAMHMMKEVYASAYEENISIPKLIVKEGLSEYFLFTIPGEETIKNTWSKRLISYSQDEIPIENLYKYEEEKYGKDVKRFLFFKNDEEHKMGKEPLPDGLIKIFKSTDKEEHLSYVGADAAKYIPIKQKVELNLGNEEGVKVEVKKMEYKTENHELDFYGNITGWDEVKNFKIKVKNMKNLNIKVEIKRNVQGKFEVDENTGNYDDYEKEDIDTFKYTLNLNPEEEKIFNYKIREFKGTRAQNK
ncbi:MAG: hypothetical protein HY753_02970 [Nitrospirae bacterium]|nr:hypothetical protein [Nitrospirota bacterium]